MSLVHLLGEQSELDDNNLVMLVQYCVVFYLTSDVSSCSKIL